MAAPDAPKTFLVVGARGSGKSSLINLLVGGPRWDTGDGNKAEVVHGGLSTETTIGPFQATDAGMPNTLFLDSTGMGDQILDSSLYQEFKSAYNVGSIHGVIFVRRVGRFDPKTDNITLRVVLNWILKVVPRERVVCIITSSRHPAVSNPPATLEEAVIGDEPDRVHAAENRERMHEYARDLASRCGGGFTCIDNPDPQGEGEFGNNDALRAASLRNVVALLDTIPGPALEGSRFFEGWLAGASEFLAWAGDHPSQVALLGLSAAGVAALSAAVAAALAAAAPATAVEAAVAVVPAGMALARTLIQKLLVVLPAAV